MQSENHSARAFRILSPFLLILIFQGGYIRHLYSHWSLKGISMLWSLLHLGMIFAYLYLQVEITSMSSTDWIKNRTNLLELVVAITRVIAFANFLIASFIYKDFLTKMFKFNDSKHRLFVRFIWIFACASPITICIFLSPEISQRHGELKCFQFITVLLLLIHRITFACIFFFIFSALCLLFYLFQTNFEHDMLLSNVSNNDRERLFEQYRKQYERLIDLVSSTDRFLCVPLGLNLLIDLVYFCFMAYFILVVGELQRTYLMKAILLMLDFLLICSGGGTLRYQVISLLNKCSLC